MDAMIYVATSGADQFLHEQAIHANNLANINTTAFKSDLAIMTSVAKDEKKLSAGVFVAGAKPKTNFSQGGLVPTGRELDVAIQGAGWFAVQSKEGPEVYTRNGSLQITQEGLLLNGQNLPLLGSGGSITIPPHHKVDIGIDGTITIVPLSDGKPVVLDRIKMVNPDLKTLVKGRDGLYRLENGQTAEADNSLKLAVGFLEKSNVNPVEEITKMISLARQYEIQLKMATVAEENEKIHGQLLVS